MRTAAGLFDLSHMGELFVTRSRCRGGARLRARDRAREARRRARALLHDLRREWRRARRSDRVSAGRDALHGGPERVECSYRGGRAEGATRRASMRARRRIDAHVARRDSGPARRRDSAAVRGRGSEDDQVLLRHADHRVRRACDSRAHGLHGRGWIRALRRVGRCDARVGHAARTPAPRAGSCPPGSARATRCGSRPGCRCTGKSSIATPHLSRRGSADS